MVRTAPLLGLLALVLAGVPAAGLEVTPAASVHAGVVWVVTGKESVVDANLTVAGKIVVRDGGVLTLDGVSLAFAGWPLPCANLEGRVCAPDLLVEPGGVLKLRNTTLAGAGPTPALYAFLVSYGRVEAEDSRLARTTGFLVSGPGASADFARNRIEASSGGIVVNRMATAVLRANVLDGVGIHVQDSVSLVEGNTVRNASIGIRAATSLVGGWCCRGAPTLAENTIVGGLTGVYADSIAPVAIRGNRIEGAGTGVTVAYPRDPESPPAAGLRLDGNLFVGTPTAVRVLNVGSKVPADLHPRASLATVLRDNDFSLSCRGVVVEAIVGMPLVADARWNWWGPAGPEGTPECPAVEGDVVVAPWLERHP